MTIDPQFVHVFGVFLKQSKTYLLKTETYLLNIPIDHHEVNEFDSI